MIFSAPAFFSCFVLSDWTVPNQAAGAMWWSDAGSDIPGCYSYDLENFELGTVPLAHHPAPKTYRELITIYLKDSDSLRFAFCSVILLGFAIPGY